MNGKEEDAGSNVLTEAGREHFKIRANWLNGISIATFAVGSLAPVTRALFEPTLTWFMAFSSLTVALVCFVVARLLHLKAATVLEELDW